MVNFQLPPADQISVAVDSCIAVPGYGPADSRTGCMFQPVAQTSIKALRPEDLGLLGCRSPKYGARVDLRAVYATGWFMHRRAEGERPLAAYRTSAPARCGRPVAGCFLEEDLDPATFRELRPTQSRRSAEGQPRGYEHRRHDAVSGKLGENVRSAADLAPSGTAGVSPSRCTEQDVLPRR